MITERQHNNQNLFKKDIDLKNISDLLIPIVSLISLVLIAIFVLIPMFNNTLETMQKTKDYKKKYEQLMTVYTGIYSINEQDLNENYVNVITLIPDSMRVSDFAKFVNDRAIKDGLELDKIKAEDTNNISLTNNTKISRIHNLKSIEAPLAYTGSYDDIVNFLEDLFVKIPFVITADSVSISLENDTEEKWKVELNIKVFYIEDTGDAKPNLYAPFTPYTHYPQELIDIRNRVKDNIK